MEKNDRNIHSLYNKLMQSQSDIVLDAAGAHAMWNFLRSNFRARLMDLTVDHFNNTQYRAYMQAYLIAVVDGSKAMSNAMYGVELARKMITGRNVALAVGEELGKVIKKLVTTAVRRFFTQSVNEKAEIYGIVLVGTENSQMSCLRWVEGRGDLSMMIGA